MLFAQITCFEDQVVADKMRGIARRLGCDPALTALAVDEAVTAYQDQGEIAEGLNAGVAFVQRARNHTPPARADDRAAIVDASLRWSDHPLAVRVVLCLSAAVLAAVVAWGFAR